jgi:hypothetical protein
MKSIEFEMAKAFVVIFLVASAFVFFADFTMNIHRGIVTSGACLIVALVLFEIARWWEHKRRPKA